MADRQSVLVGLTEEYGKAPSRQLNKQVERVQHCVTNLTVLLSSWTGYFVLCMDNFRAIRSLISTLHVPIPEVKVGVLPIEIGIGLTNRMLSSISFIPACGSSRPLGRRLSSKGSV